MNEALHAMPHVGLDAAEVTPLLACRLADLKAFELPRFVGVPEDEAEYPLDPRPQARRRAQDGTDAGPDMTAIASQSRLDGRFWRGVAPSCGEEAD
jgi:hypothetical protein